MKDINAPTRQSDMEEASQSKDVKIVNQAGFCVDCGDQIAVLTCNTCMDDYCLICFSSLHRRGSRAKHTYVDLTDSKVVSDQVETLLQSQKDTLHKSQIYAKQDNQTKTQSQSQSQPQPQPQQTTTKKNNVDMTITPTITISQPVSTTTTTTTTTTDMTQPLIKTNITSTPESILSTPEDIDEYIYRLSNIKMNYEYIPMRLTDYERQLLHILEEAITISGFTDKVDVFHANSSSKQAVIMEEIESFLNTIYGLYIAHDFRIARREIRSVDTRSKSSGFSNSNDMSSNHRGGNYNMSNLSFLRQHAELFQRVIEVGRRHKIRNPDKMRTTYGKLMFILMDAQNPTILSRLGFTLVIPIRTASTVLEEYFSDDIILEILQHEHDINVENTSSSKLRKAVQEVRDKLIRIVLTDPHLLNATSLLLSRSMNTLESERRQYLSTQALQWRKDNKDTYITSFSSTQLSPLPNLIVPIDILEDIVGALFDVTAYIGQVYEPLEYLQQMLYDVEDTYDLSIRAGVNKARISHNHNSQVLFVSQTIDLWKMIITFMIRLWQCADDDMLSSSNGYQLRNTGQGLNRMQGAPNVANVMHYIVSTQMKKANNKWIGSSAVHLGDQSVPNALVFIDKYCQVERITAPLVSCLQSLSASHAECATISKTLHTKMTEMVQERKRSNIKVKSDKEKDSEREMDGENRENRMDDSNSQDDQNGNKMDIEGEDDGDGDVDADTDAEADANADSKLHALIHDLSASGKARYTSALPQQNDTEYDILSRIGFGRFILSYTVQNKAFSQYTSSDIIQLTAALFPHAKKKAIQLEKFLPLNIALRRKSLPKSVMYRILAAVFSDGFNGSGEPNANAMTAGSCIDGRLTSLWEYCNSIEKTDYYAPLLAGGFNGFDSTF